jgi:uncharacterized protein YozE (UPF0346 family)
MKRFRPAEPDKHGDKKKLAEQTHDDNCLPHKPAKFDERIQSKKQDNETT